MMSFLARVFGWLAARFGAVIGQGFLVDVAKWVASKALITLFCTVGVYIIANNVIVWFIEKVLSQVSAFASQGSLSAPIIQLTGIGAYLADHLLLPQALALVITGFSVRAIRQFLPF